MLTSYDENKKILTLKNIFNEVYKFLVRCIMPLKISFVQSVTYMLQSNYTLDASFISRFNKIDSKLAELLLWIVHNPNKVRPSHVRAVIMDEFANVGTKRQRYYILDHPDPTQESRAVAPLTTHGPTMAHRYVCIIFSIP